MRRPLLRGLSFQQQLTVPYCHASKCPHPHTCTVADYTRPPATTPASPLTRTRTHPLLPTPTHTHRLPEPHPSPQNPPNTPPKLPLPPGRSRRGRNPHARRLLLDASGGARAPGGVGDRTWRAAGAGAALHHGRRHKGRAAARAGLWTPLPNQDRTHGDRQRGEQGGVLRQ